MKKIAVISLMGALMVLLAATAAMAAEPYYHGDFADNSLGCAKCHITHAGEAAALLIEGPKQTDFCFYCHSGLAKSPYDALQGKIATPTGTMPSVAGGFLKTYDFDTKPYNSVGAATVTNYVYSTSVHGVENYDANDWVSGAVIPGGTSTLTGTFRCGSCHDPHAGGNYPATGVMPRLMKKELPETTFDPADFQDWEFDNKGDSATYGYKTMVLTEYGNDAGLWCAGCHDLFNQRDPDAGQNPVSDTTTGVSNKYMHRMNFTIDSDSEGTGAIEHNNIYQVALSVGNKLTCLTCHRAHGTGSGTSETIWNRATDYEDSLSGSDDSTTSKSSVLLREENRDVCYDCHGAATYNKPSQQTNGE